jgi:hypothetical protein
MVDSTRNKTYVTIKPLNDEVTDSNESDSPLRTFSWSYWLILTTIVASLAFYFIRRSKQVEAAAIVPTSVLDAQIGFTPSGAYDTLSSLGPRGRDIYKEVNRVDFLLAPIVFREYILHTIPPASLARGRVRDFLANTYIIGEVMENTSIAIMLKTFPKLLDLFAWTGCVGNLLKWFGACGGALSILYEGFVWVRERKINTH